MKKYLLTPLAAALTLTLTACGGDSSGKDTPEKGPGSGSGGVTTPAPLQKISLEAYTYSCQTDTPYATDIVFHDKDGKPVGTAKTNAEGVFSGEVPKDTKHVSVLGDEVDAADGTYKKIHTRLDTENRTNLGKFTFYRDQSDCGCDTYTLDTSELSFLQSGYSLYNGYTTTVSDSIQVCSQEETYFSVVAGDKSEAKATIIKVPTDSNVIKLTDEDFSHQGVEVTHQISSNANFITTVGYFEKTHSYRFWQYTFANDLSPLYVFPSLTDHSFYRQSFGDSNNVGDVNVRINTHARSRVNSDGSYVLNELPTPPTSLSEDLIAFATASDLSYDFSSADSRLTSVYIDFSFLVDDAAETRFDMSIQGYIQGQVPDLSFGDVFPEPVGNATLEQLDIFLYGYAGNPTDKKSVDGLIEEIAQGKHLTKEKFSNYLYINLSASLN